MAPHHLALVVLVCAVWGFNFIAGKVGVGHFPPLFFTAVRFVIVGALLAPFLRYHAGRMGLVLMIGIFAGSVHFALMFSGLRVADVSVASVVVQLNVPFVTLLSVVMLGERIRWKRGLGIAMAILGIMVISFDPAVFDQATGLSLMALAALSMAVGMVLMRRITGVSPMGMQAWIATLSAPVLLLGSFAIETDQWQSLQNADTMEWSALLYTAIGASIVGHGGMFYLLQRYEASKIGPLTVMAPVFSIVSGVTIMGEPLTERIVLGSALTLVGVVIVSLREGQMKKITDTELESPS